MIPEAKSKFWLKEDCNNLLNKFLLLIMHWTDPLEGPDISSVTYHYTILLLVVVKWFERYFNISSFLPVSSKNLN